jgi:alanine-synthesizing transaminase
MDENQYSRLLAAKQTNDPKFIDLALSNPTQAGFSYPIEEIRRALSEVHPYRPDPQGCLDAREEIARYYRRHGRAISPEQILLTSCTSEAYSLLIKILCDAEDEVLAPVPSYPLFSILLEAEGVAGVPYALARTAAGWNWDETNAEEQRTDRTCALIAVSPNNPTGTTLDDSQLRQALGWCARHSLPMILDEVFLDYPGESTAGNPLAAAEEQGALLFALGGLSKCAGLPQLKLSWVAVGGPEPLRQEAMHRLAFLSDAYLTVGTPVQHAMSELFRIGQGIQAQIKNRIGENEHILREWEGRHPSCGIFPRPGGWYAVCRLPADVDDETFVYRLLDEQSVAVHPGYFYDIEDMNVIVLSLICEKEKFAEGLRRIAMLIPAP